MKTEKIFLTFVICLAVCFLFPAAAFAYLDPGTGSYIFQILIAGAVGVAFVIKTFWSKLVSFFGRLFGTGKNSRGKHG